MQKKKKQILEAALRLFARQGFHATSIQEIVDDVGMAKGSIYFYFKSKDDLLASIVEYYGEQMHAGMAEHPGEADLAPRERMRLQLERQFSFLREHAEFMQMLIKEPLAGVHQEQLKTFAFRFRSSYLQWLYRHIRTIYGSEAERYWADGVLLFGGMMSQFMESLMIDRDAFDASVLARYLIRRIDDLMRGLIDAGDAPIISAASMQRMIAFGAGGPDEAQTAGLLRQLRELAAGTDAEETTALLAAELGKAPPHPVMVRALLALLEKQAEPSMREPLRQLAEQLEKVPSGEQD